MAERDYSQSGKGAGGLKRRENLLRLKRFRAEELKRRNVTLETMSSEVERKLSDLEEAVAREKQRAHEFGYWQACLSELPARDGRTT